MVFQGGLAEAPERRRDQGMSSCNENCGGMQRDLHPFFVMRCMFRGKCRHVCACLRIGKSCRDIPERLTADSYHIRRKIPYGSWTMNTLMTRINSCRISRRDISGWRDAHLLANLYAFSAIRSHGKPADNMMSCIQDMSVIIIVFISGIFFITVSIIIFIIFPGFNP